MDARPQSAAARPLGAAEPTRDRFCGIPARALAFLLANVMFWQPLWAQAEGIVVVTPGVKIDQAGNGVQVINIAKPNGTGLSHNVYHDYNVGTQGLILNNGSTQTSYTQLGGYVIGNPNLTKSGSAQVILNEVIGGSQSQLKGYTEVAGQSARVIVANPYGITCNGCGFINTPQATLTTGKPVIGEGGRLERFQVDNGTVAIEGAGLNASNVDSVEIITRSAQINAQIHAKNLTIVAGRNDVDASTLDAVARADDGSAKPQLAIDASALGGMYAGAIRLVGTEEGVGVRTAGDLVASAGDIQIDANGQVTTARISASGNLGIKGQDIALTDDAYAGGKADLQAQDQLTFHQDKSLMVADELRLGGQRITNQGTLQVGVNADGSQNTHGALDINGGELTNRGKIVATGTLNTDVQALDNTGAQVAAGQATIKAGSLSNQGGVLLSEQVMDITAEQTLKNSDDGLILSKAGTLTVRADSLDNQGGILQASNAGVDVTTRQTLDNTRGKIIAGGGPLTLKAAELINQQGVLQAQGGALKVTAASLDNRQGTVNGQHLELTLDGDLNNDEGLVEASDSLKISAGSASNNKGQLRALGSDGKSQFTLGGLFNNDAGLVEINNARFALNSQGLSNQGGSIRHAGDQGFDVSLADAGQAGGSFSTNGVLSLEVGDWTNTSVLQARKLTLKVGNLTQTADGKLLSAESIEASGDSWVNDGRIETNGSLELALTGSYTGNGTLLSQGDMRITATSTSLGGGAEMRSAGAGTYNLGTHLVNAGRISAANDVVLQVDSLTNTGTLGAGQQLSIETQTLLNQDGLIFSGADMLVHTDSLTNLRGTLYSLGSLDIAKDASQQRASLIENISGTLESAGDMRLLANSLINRKQVFVTQLQQISGTLRLSNTDDCKGEHCEADYRAVETYGTVITEDSARANLIAGGNLSFTGESFDNQYSTVAAGQDLSISSDNFWSTGAGGGEQRTSGYYIYTKDRNEYYGFVAKIPTYNSYHNPESASYNPTAMPLSSIKIGIRTGYSVVQTSGDVAAQAVVQAGGDVTITGTQTLSNAVVRPGESITRGPDQTVDTDVSLTDKNVSHLNSQLPPDLAQQAVDPLNLPGFDLPQGTNGLFQVSTNPSHPYLVETNPLFADLKTFLSSDYLLDALGYDPDQSMRRLGDGLYEQQLIREAVVERTGKRFLEGLTSDEAMFRYLMDNSIASKDELNLSPGVALTAEQVAALTHDIVWMEPREVNGEQVLVPVLYLAHANDRLAPNGALIQGQDVALITGGDLKNQGTLRAESNLLAITGNVENNGLMQANEHLALLATESIRNAMGGIIKGEDVSANALTGNLTNERTIGTTKGQNAIFKWSSSTADNAARIEAGNTLGLAAGLNLLNVGGVLQAGGDASVTAGGNLQIVSAEEKDSSSAVFKRSSSSHSRVTQHGSDVQVGGSLTASAGGDFSVVASTVKAGKDIQLYATGNVNIASAANESHFEYHSKRRGKKLDQQDDTVRQQSSVIEAGGDLDIGAEKNLRVSASQLTAGNEAYLYAGEKLSMEAAQNLDYHLYDYNKKGSFGSKQAQRDEVTDVKHVGSRITTGGDLTLVSEGDQLYQVAKLDSGKDITLDSGGGITFEAVKDLHDESHTKTNNNAFWNSAKGKGNTDETLRQTQMQAAGEITIKAVEDLRIDLKKIDQRSVSQTIDAMVKADPQLAWIKAAEARGEVDWRQVREIHESFKYNTSGLGPASQLIVAIAIAAALGPAGLGMTGMPLAGASSLATTATVSTINNKGDLGAAFKETFSVDSLKNVAISIAVAGIAEKFLDPKLAGKDAAFKSTNGFDLGTLKGIFGYSVHAGAIGLTTGAVKTAVNGGSLGDNVLDGMTAQAVNVVAAVAFNNIGTFAEKQLATARLNNDSNGIALWVEGGAARIALHAMVGGAVSSATGGDFLTGAAAAGASQAMAGALKDVFQTKPEIREAFAQIIGLTSAGLAGGDMIKGAWVAQMADRFNRQAHPDEIRLIKQEAEALAKAQGISTAEAEQRLAQAFAYYTDKQWQERLNREGLVIDSGTLEHLAHALMPLADRYDVASSADVPPVADPGKTYTQGQTLALIQGYATNHRAYFEDATEYGEYLLVGKDGGNAEYAKYYENNLNFGQVDLGADAVGAGKGISDSLNDLFKGFFELAKGLVFEPEKTTTGVLNELIKSASNPDEVYKAFMQARQDKDIQVVLYRLQGDPEAAARLEMKWEMDFYSNFILVNRVGKLGQVAKMLAEEERMITLQGTVAGKELSELKGVAGLPEWYRDISGVGANVVVPEGYKAVVNTKTGNIEYLASDGTLYLNTDAGLRPKLGGNLTELSAAEREIQASKEGGSGGSGGGGVGLERVAPPTPKVDVTNEFMMSVSGEGTTLRYGNPEGVAGLVVNVDKAGVLGFEIRAAQNHPLYDASGTDMFASAMQRLGNEGIQVNQIRGAWETGTDSVNTAKYLQNIASGMSKENAALDTWTGQISQRFGYTKVEKIEDIGGVTYVTFGK